MTPSAQPDRPETRTTPLRDKQTLCALYARISTFEGKQFSSNQLIELRQFAERHGWKIYREYVDESSGSKSDRNALAELMRDAHQAHFQVVLVWALDRFTREGVLKAFQYIETLKQHGVDFVSASEPQFQTAGPFGEVFLALSAAFAKMERQRLQERVKAGLERAKANGTRSGKPIGRSIRVFDRARAQELRDAGMSWNHIAAVMNVPPSTVRRGVAKTLSA